MVKDKVKDKISEYEKMIDEHWEYVKSTLIVHGIDEETLKTSEHHYKTAMRHGIKHGRDKK